MTATETEADSNPDLDADPATEVAAEETFRFRPDSPEVPRPVRWIVLAFLGLIAVTRSPYIFHFGRFWAEEGELHFAYMVAKPFPHDILYVQLRTGYYNAFADWGTWLASHVPLRDAPLVTVWLSFAILLLAMWIALAWPSDLLPNAAAKLAGAAVILVGTLALAEVWLNTINAQTYLCITALMLLFVRVDDLSKWRYRIGIALLVLCGLSGLYTVALAPLFVVCGLLDRTRRRWTYAGVIVAAGVTQFLVLAHTRASGKLEGSKLAAPSGPSVFRGFVGFHLTGLVLPQRTFAPWIRSSTLGRGNGTLDLTIVGLLVAAFIVVLLWTGAKRHRVAFLLLGALVLVEILVQVGDLRGDAGGRYAVVPVAILSMMVIYGTATTRIPVMRWAGVGVVSLILLVGLSEFWTTSKIKLSCENCPTWASQVQQYQAGKLDDLQIWPYNKPWIVPMPPHKPVPPAVPPPGASTATTTPTTIPAAPTTTSPTSTTTTTTPG